MDCGPSASELAVPIGSSTSNVHKFFTFQPSNTIKAQTGNFMSGIQPSPNVAQKQAQPFWAQPLTPPPTPGLTRSELLFSVGTAVDVRSLAIQGDLEFYLFMDMRAEFQWTSFTMTSQKWVSATVAYNKTLKERGNLQGVPVVKKNPRALMDKLSEVEPKISKRLITKNFTCISF